VARPHEAGARLAIRLSGTHLELRSDGQPVQSGVIECASNDAVGLGALYVVRDVGERSQAILVYGDGNTSDLE
jgi:hypothetical protein